MKNTHDSFICLAVAVDDMLHECSKYIMRTVAITDVIKLLTGSD